MARKGILSPTSSAPAPRRATPAAAPSPTAPRGAVGALQSSLAKLQENALQEIEAARIFDAGMTDRLGPDVQADTALLESLRTYGQQVPVLVRPRAAQPGTFEIVYGRRRVQALRALGLPVKAMVRQLDDTALVLAQGQENTARRDLSFIEKASFAAQLDALSYGKDTICAALSIDLPMLSRMLKVGRAFELDFLRAVGSAPGIGRDRWLRLVAALERDGARARVAAGRDALRDIDDSDARFEAVLALAETPGPAQEETEGPEIPEVASEPPVARARTQKVTSDAGTLIGQVRRDARGLTVTVPNGDAPEFASWVAEQGEDLLRDLYARWLAEQEEGA